MEDQPKIHAERSSRSRETGASGRSSLRLGAVIALVVVTAIIAWALVARNDDSPSSSAEVANVIEPTAYSAQGLRTLSRSVNAPIYWAGPQAGYTYELTRTENGSIYVRYLPPGVTAGVGGARYLVVATYPFAGALEALRKVAAGEAVDVPGSGIAVPSENYPQSVHVAFPNLNYQIEVYDPSPARSLRVATSGRLKPVQ